MRSTNISSLNTPNNGERGRCRAPSFPSPVRSGRAGILETRVLYISYGPPTIDGALGHAQGVFY